MFKSLELSHYKVIRCFLISEVGLLFIVSWPHNEPTPFLEMMFTFSIGSEWTKPGMCPATIYECKWLWVCDFSCLPLHYKNEEVFPSLSVQPSCIQVLSEAALTRQQHHFSAQPGFHAGKKKPSQPYSAKTEGYLSNDQPSHQHLKSCRSIATITQSHAHRKINFKIVERKQSCKNIVLVH